MLNTIRLILRKWLGVQDIQADQPKETGGIKATLLGRTAKEPVVAVGRYTPPNGVIPKGKEDAVLAMDTTDYGYINDASVTNYWQGYPQLSMLAQLPEYRKLSNEVAKAMTRKWIKLEAKGEDKGGDKADKLAKLNDALIRFKVRDLFKDAAEHDGLFGRGQLFIDIDMPSGGSAKDDPNELETPLIIHKAKIKKNSLKALRIVEPVWTYPSAYNARDPLAADFYRPSKWYVMSKVIHASRMLMFVSRPMPDLLKAAYNFGGLSMSQLAQPYVQNWIRTRDSVSDLVHSFSISGIKTDMSTVLQGGDDAKFLNRATLFNQMRDNRGLMILDKDSEEFFQMNTPLSGLDSLQQQAQEQMASVSSMPLIVLLGITPSGLNASSEGELRVWNDFIKGQQEAIFRDNLKIVLDILQLNEFGEIDEDIIAEFESLEEMTDEQKATIEKTKADTDNILIQAGVISPEEVRGRIAADPRSGYNAIDVDDMPEQEEEPPKDDPEFGQAADAEFKESDHPRAKSGQFGEGGGGSTKAKTAGETAAIPERKAQLAKARAEAEAELDEDGLAKAREEVE
jgi:phage-related protein (TIGR01555 family)